MSERGGLTYRQAIRALLDDDVGDYEGMEDKYNTWHFLCGPGSEGGIPDTDGTEWYGEVSTCYGRSEGVTFRSSAEVLQKLWADVDPENLRDGFNTEAWVVLGFDVQGVIDEYEARAK